MNWFTKLFGSNSRHTDLLAESVMRKYTEGSDLENLVKQYIRSDVSQAPGTGLSRRDIYQFCLRYPRVAEKFIADWFDHHKVVKS